MPDRITIELAGLTDRVLAYRIYRFGVHDMDRLKEKLARAAQVAPRATAAIEADADALIAREADLEVRRKEAFAPHHALLDSHKRDLDQLEDALQIVGNSDPLGSSGVSQEVEGERHTTFQGE